MEAVTYETYRKGHDHCAEARREEATKVDKSKAEYLLGGTTAASGSNSNRGKRSNKKSLGFWSKRSWKIFAWRRRRGLRPKHKEEKEAVLLLGNV